MRKFRNLFAISFATVFAAATIYSCSKDDISINVGNEQSQNSGGGSSSTDSTGNGSGNGTGTDAAEQSKLFFNAAVYDMLTKAASTSPIGVGRYATIYAYNGTAKVTSVQYESKEQGYLNPLSAADTMSLATGTYTLYGAGVNYPTMTTVPVFSGTSVSGLETNVDYIWTSYPNLVVKNVSQNVSLNFTHSCTQVVIAMMDPNNLISATATPTMTMTPSSNTSNTWNLIDGKISYSTTIASNQVNMPVAKNTTQGKNPVYYGQLIMMPLETSADSLIAKFNVTVNSVANNYEVKLPVFQGELEAGNAYVYYVEFTEAGVTFNNTVTVTNWVTVDVNKGTPIIPTQI